MEMKNTEKSEKMNRLNYMLDEPYFRNRAILELDMLGAKAQAAVPKLWEIASDDDGQPEAAIRLAALNAIISIERDKPDTIRLLLKRLENDRSPEVRLQVAQLLRDKGSTAKSAMPKLEELLNCESFSEVRWAIVRAIIQLGEDKEQEELIKRALQALQDSIKGPSTVNITTLAALSILEMGMSDMPVDQRQEALDAMWAIMEQPDQEQHIGEVFDAILHITSNNDEVLKNLLASEKIDLSYKRKVILKNALGDNIVNQFKIATDTTGTKAKILEILLESLKSSEGWFLERTLALLDDILKNSPSDYNNVLNDVQEVLEAHGNGLSLIYKHRPKEIEKWIDQEDQPDNIKCKIGNFLVQDPKAQQLLKKWWNDNDSDKKEQVLEYVLAALKIQDWDTRWEVMEWLRSRILTIPPILIDRVRQVLKELQDEAEKDTSTQNWVKIMVSATLIPFNQKSESLEEKSLLEGIRCTEEGDELIKTIKDLVSVGSASLLRQLVNEWVRWIIYENRPSVIDTAADSIRYSRFAVLPLVDQLAKGILLNDSQLRDKVLDEIKVTWPQIPPFLNQNIETNGKSVPRDSQIRNEGLEEVGVTSSQNLPLLGGSDLNIEINKADEISLREWIKTYENRSDKFTELLQKAKNQQWSLKRQAKEIVQLLTAEKQRERMLVKNQRIARQLADMSDERFFDERPNEYDEVRKELKAHAVPVLVRLLPKETDTVIRENFARTLGNLGGREAVDALVHAVVEEEKKRNARQDLLATYYLEPSKRQSEDAAKILSGAVNDAKNTLNLLQKMNIAVFLVGIILLVAGVLTSLLSQDAATRLVGGLTGIGGLAGVIVQLIRNPLDRIQNAMANLVQLETAFTSFIWELNLNGTYIQSQYVAEGILTNDEIAQTVGRIENAMSLAMNLVAVYTEEGRQRVVTRINNLSPAAGEASTHITVHGQHLQGDSSEKKVLEGMIAINHTPIQSDIIFWKEEAVKFKLPTKVPGLGDGSGTIWVSLLIDGMETNALPFHVMRNGARTVAASMGAVSDVDSTPHVMNNGASTIAAEAQG